MREIKFRAWSFGLKKMFSAEEMTQDQMALLPDGHFANIHSHSVKLSRIFSHDEMLPMQFTGLFDKNGKEIYEGDVAKVLWAEGTYRGSAYNGGLNYTEFGVMKFDDGRFSFHLKDSLLEESSEDLIIEVIGNIYENPELLTPTDNNKGE